MIIFYKTKNCQSCRTIEDMLTELCMPFKVMALEDRDELPKTLPADASLPLLIDEQKILQGPTEIINHLEELGRLKEQWYKFQSDVCYCDEEGNVE